MIVQPNKRYMTCKQYTLMILNIYEDKKNKNYSS